MLKSERKRRGAIKSCVKLEAGKEADKILFPNISAAAQGRKLKTVEVKEIQMEGLFCKFKISESLKLKAKGRPFETVETKEIERKI